MLIQKFSTFNEARYEDMYSPAFVAFVTKYRELVASGKLKAPDTYYVQFTNERDNVLDKSIHQNPDHADPVGVYAYPLSYVLNHPSDIWYGSAARNLRLLKDKSRYKLLLSTIRGKSTLTKALDGIGMDAADQKRLIKVAQYNYTTRFTGTNGYAKLFMSLLQMDFDGERDAQNRIQTIPGTEQSKRLLNAYDAIEDRSRSIEDAIINDREPEQICFLNRAAFAVIEAVHLHRNQKVGKHIAISKPDVRKVAAMLAAVMGDKLITTAEMRGFNTGGMFWTRQGRRIELDFNATSKYREDLGMGQKKHRYAKDFDHRDVRGYVECEWGKLSVHAEPDASFATIVQEFTDEWEWQQERGTKTDWEPENKVSYDRKLKAKQDAELAISRAKAVKEFEEDDRHTMKTMAKWAEKLGIDFMRTDIGCPPDLYLELGGNVRKLINKFGKGKMTPEEAQELITQYFDPLGDAHEYYEERKYIHIKASLDLFRAIFDKYPQVFSRPNEVEMRFYALRPD